MTPTTTAPPDGDGAQSPATGPAPERPAAPAAATRETAGRDASRTASTDGRLPAGATATTRPGTTLRRWAGLLVGLALLALCCLAGLALGTQHLGVREVLSALRGHGSPDALLVVRQLRLPRTVLALVAGLGLGVSGALAQAVTRNPLADPGILGTTSGAAFAVALLAGFTGTSSHPALMAAAFVGAAVATVAVHLVGSTGRAGGNPVRLVLAGTALGAVLASIAQAIVLTDPERFEVMNSWRAGSLAERGWGGLGLGAVVVGIGLLLALGLSSSLNAVALGDDLATSLGANVALVRTLSVLAITLLAGTATALAGPIAFVGLVVPHVARWFTGPDQRWIMLWSAVLGPVLLLLADVVGRLAIQPGELPAGIVTSFVGAPVLIALVRRRTVEL